MNIKLHTINPLKAKSTVQRIIILFAWILLALVGVCVLYFAVIALLVAFFGFIGLYLLGLLHKRL